MPMCGQYARGPCAWWRVLRVAVAMGLLLLTAACGAAEETATGVQETIAGDVEAGRVALDSYGCGTCHHVPGVPSATGGTGPPLDGWAERRFIAGSLPNEPAYLIQWIRFPQAIEPGTAMPNLDVTEEDARNMGAYLYTLDGDERWYHELWRSVRWSLATEHAGAEPADVNE